MSAIGLPCCDLGGGIAKYNSDISLSAYRIVKTRRISKESRIGAVTMRMSANGGDHRHREGSLSNS